jgi:RimJ/RimL family protein N-acetyltransferase
MYTFEKLASNLSDTKDILDIIYNENPDHWPNGLSSDHFDGGLYVVKKQASSEPVGFVGWQERREDFNKVGYYSVGVLEKYRRNGFAKQAITQLLQKKASGVDIVKALIMKDNTPSISLAEKLDGVVMDVKQATYDKEARRKRRRKTRRSRNSHSNLATAGAAGKGKQLVSGMADGADVIEDYKSIGEFLSHRKGTRKKIDFGDKEASEDKKEKKEESEEKPLSTRTKDLQSKLDRLVERYQVKRPWYNMGFGPEMTSGTDVVGQTMDEDYFKRRGTPNKMMVKSQGPDHFGLYDHLINDNFGTTYEKGASSGLKRYLGK